MRAAAQDIEAGRSLDPTIAAHLRRSVDLLALTYEVAGERFARPIYEKAAERNLVTKDFERFQELLEQYIEEIGLPQGRLIAGTTREQVLSSVARGTAEGLGLPQIAADIRARSTALSVARAAVIARTETHSASMWAQVEAIKDTGLVLRKEWVSALDERTRTLEDGPFDHAAMDGTIVGPDEDFNVGGEDLAYPGDPKGSAANIINCRCVLNFVE
jgi:uncharacterized protein with gpF-like domain